MNVLCDLISFQSGFSGGAEYTKRICKELVTCKEIVVYGFFDSKRYVHAEYTRFIENNAIQPIDINEIPIREIVLRFNIHKLFIGVQSLLTQYDFHDVPCKIVVTVHDLRNHDILLNDIRARLVYHAANFETKIKQFIAKIYPSYTYKWAYQSIDIKLLEKENVFITTVSNYSKSAILYYYPQLQKKDIKVFYPPLKDIPQRHVEIENERLKYLIEKKLPYFLLVSGKVPVKNVDIFLRVFEKLSKFYPSYYCLVTGMDTLYVNNEKVVTVNYLSTSDLEYAYANASIFVYPTYQEGFGYPPLEAMKYGVPCCVSNVTSLPEVYGDSVVYFSPFYEADIFGKVLYLIANIDDYRKRSMSHYEKMVLSQNKDLRGLVDYILSV